MASIPNTCELAVACCSRINRAATAPWARLSSKSGTEVGQGASLCKPQKLAKCTKLVFAAHASDFKCVLKSQESRVRWQSKL